MGGRLAAPPAGVKLDMFTRGLIDITIHSNATKPFFPAHKTLATKHVLLLRSSSGMNQSLDLDTLCLRSWSQNARHYIGVKELGGSPGSIYVNTYTRDIQGLNGPDA